MQFSNIKIPIDIVDRDVDYKSHFRVCESLAQLGIVP